jgi:hypothetical protein
MKKILCCILLSFILFSCQETELEYSCDPVINKFVIENKAEFSQISVTELSTYEVALQKAVFRSWDSEKKRTAWLDKLQYVLCSNSLSTAESNHIQKLIDHLDVGYFLAENIEKNLAVRVKFANEWLNYAKKDLGWSEQFIAFIVYRLYTKQSQFEVELSVLKSIKLKTSTNSECNCNTSADFCPGSACTSGCSTSSGCGWLWSGSCDGSC